MNEVYSAVENTTCLSPTMFFHVQIFLLSSWINSQIPCFLLVDLLINGKCLSLKQDFFLADGRKWKCFFRLIKSMNKYKKCDPKTV